MELALTTLLLLPGVVSLSMATAPRCRALAPRDLPAALVATLGFALLNFFLAGLACKLTPGWAAPNLGPTAAVLLTGTDHSGMTRTDVLASFFEPRWKNWLALLYLTIATLSTGKLGAFLYDRLLEILTRKESQTFGIQEKRTSGGVRFDRLLEWLGLPDLAITRGASYWLIVQQTAKLLAEKQPEVYADITQGEDATLYAGQVVQVITSRTGETLSIVLKKARRYRRNVYSDPNKYGIRQIVKKAGWKQIGDSEAFYMRGESVHNISYRIYGDPARGGYANGTRAGETWLLPDAVYRALLKVRRA